MDVPPLSAAAKVMIGGALVLGGGNSDRVELKRARHLGLRLHERPVNGTNGMIAPP